PSNSIDAQFSAADKSKPIVCFGSFQDFLGVDKDGGIKTHNSWVHEEPWDLVIFDEYHFGAWRDSAKKLFDIDDDVYEAVTDQKKREEEAREELDESWLPISASHYLYLSGTPFRALNSGEFLEEQIFNWTYADEQRAKASWVGPEESNPYAELPQMVMMTYKIPAEIERIAKNEQFNEFDLNIFFKAEGKGSSAKFVYEDYVNKWLQLIRGSYLPTGLNDLKLGARPPMPFSDTRLLNYLKHTIWFMPSVAACEAMGNLLKKDVFFADYGVNVCAGTAAGVGLEALGPVQKSMADPVNSRTITLTCGKLTTGVTVRPWTGIFMLRNLSTPETYFQAAFRVQSPWTIKGEDGKREIIKRQCFVFDFALNRALRQISDYSTRLDTKEANPEKKVAEFINFLPVLAYNGSTMERVDAQGILDLTTNGITATMLARRWESALLVNVDNDTLRRLMANEEAMAALMRIEGFRSLNQDIATIINKSEHVKKAKKEGESLTPKQKKELTEEEKEYKSKRKEIQEKLIKFATRIPIFMYLTDFRENTLKDVITQLEPALFRKVTGLTVRDFDLLVSLNVFNESLMNDAVWKFRRYEDSSLNYTGINKHEGEKLGLFGTVITAEDIAAMEGEVIASQKAPIRHEPLPQKPVAVQYEDESEENTSSPAPAKDDPVGSVLQTNVREQRHAQTSIQENGPRVSETTKVDPTTIRVGSVVKHFTKGEGEVVEITGGVIKVLYPGEKKPRMYEFPKAFINGYFIK
ncbi:MAG: restriction endonuclease, partial [Bacilli bacterium]|nr:restriction endonuclease [Bacilli bacterium]